MAQNDYIPVQFTLVDHPKLDELVEALQDIDPDVSEAQAIGHLVALWIFTARNGEQGDIVKFKPKQIAKASRWTGDPEAFLRALIDNEFLDEWEAPDGTRGLCVHSWYEHYGRLDKERRRNAADQQVSRENKRRAKHGQPPLTARERADFLIGRGFGEIEALHEASA